MLGGSREERSCGTDEQCGSGALLKRISRSAFKGQGHSEIKCTFAAEAYISTVWRRGALLVLFLSMSAMSTRELLNACEYRIIFTCSSSSSSRKIVVVAEKKVQI